LVAGVVDEDDLAGGFDEVFAEFGEGEGGLGEGLEVGLPVCEGRVVGVVEGFLGGAEPDEGEGVRLGEAGCEG
jgi:hypothetical protein